MATSMPNQKRKRGRPAALRETGASPPPSPRNKRLGTESTTRKETANTVDNGLVKPTSKRGRKRKSLAPGLKEASAHIGVDQGDQEIRTEDTTRPKKKTRGNGDARLPAETSEPQTRAGNLPRKPGRPHRNPTQIQDQETGETGKETGTERSHHEGSLIADQSTEGQGVGPRRSTRDRSSTKEARRRNSPLQPHEKQQATPRESLTGREEIPVSEAQKLVSSGRLVRKESKPRGRPPAVSRKPAHDESGPSDATLENNASDRSATVPTKDAHRSRAKQAAADGRTVSPQDGDERGEPGPSRQTEDGHVSTPNPRTSKLQVNANGDEESSQASEAQSGYQRLTTRTRQIPRSVIAKKWIALDDAAMTAIDSIVSDAIRPVLFELRDSDRRHQQAQGILHRFSTRLRNKLRKGMPFPPPSAGFTKRAAGSAGSAGRHVDEFDFERTVDAIQSLEATLNPLLHSVDLLTWEEELEGWRLEADYSTLRALEANARRDVMNVREQSKRDHVLAPDRKSHVEVGFHPEAVSELYQKGDDSSREIFTELPDEEMSTLAQQLKGHMDSMRNNLSQIDGVLPSIEKSKVALQGVLLRHLAPEQYEQALLG